MKFDYYGCTKTGSVREINEDMILMCTSGSAALFLVADGIGGKEHGEAVSGMLRDGFHSWWNTDFLASSEETSFQKHLELIREKLLQINREVVRRFGERTAGSTVVLLFLNGKNCAVLSAGDSRAYRIRGLDLRQITRDDVFENLPAERASRYSSSAAGKLVGAVGITSHLEFSIRTEMIRSNDRYFLCSDGVYRYVQKQKLRRRLLLESLLHSPEHIIRGLCKDVERNGSGDNYSMIFVKFH